MASTSSTRQQSSTLPRFKETQPQGLPWGYPGISCEWETHGTCLNAIYEHRLDWYWRFLLWMLYSIKSSPSERQSVTGLQPNVPVILSSRINLYTVYINTHTHILLLTVNFSVDLGSGLRWREWTVICLWPVIVVLQLQIQWAEVQSCFVREIILLYSVLFCVFTAVHKFGS